MTSSIDIKKVFVVSRQVEHILQSSEYSLVSTSSRAHKYTHARTHIFPGQYLPKCLLFSFTVQLCKAKVSIDVFE